MNSTLRSAVLLCLVAGCTSASYRAPKPVSDPPSVGARSAAARVPPALLPAPTVLRQPLRLLLPLTGGVPLVLTGPRAGLPHFVVLPKPGSDLTPANSLGAELLAGELEYRFRLPAGSAQVLLWRF